MIVPGALVEARYDCMLWSMSDCHPGIEGSKRCGHLYKGCQAIVVAKIGSGYLIKHRVLLLTSEGYLGWCLPDYIDEVT